MRPTRREVLAGSGAAIAAGALGGRLTGPAPAAAATGQAAQAAPTPVLGTQPLTNTQYWAFADWVFGAIDGEWNPSQSAYGTDARTSAAALVAHSVAAITGHTGPTRQDDRARRIVARLLQSPPFRPPPPSGSNDPKAPSQAHTPGWTSSLTTITGQQQIAIDSKVAEGLLFAWKARGVLGLSATTVTAIRDAIVGTASGPFFKYPGIRLNQINFPCELYAYAAEVSGSNDLLTNDYREQLSRFLRGSRSVVAPWITENFSASWSFHRDPLQSPTGEENLESAEYINIILELLLFYPQARAAGMPALAGAELDAMRAIVIRALPAYWTHSGYLNWDTGLYRDRWHLGRYWGFALQGLFAIAHADELRGQDEGAWAKWMFDRSLATYLRLALAAGKTRIPDSPLFDITTTFSVNKPDFAVRFLLHSTRAIAYGFQGRTSRRPPPLYAFDPGIGRLAITTPTYNTAVMATSNKAIPYGGIELARLYDDDQKVVGGVGGYGAAGFGVTIRSKSKVVLESQRVVRSSSKPQIVLTKSPQGKVNAGSRYPKKPYAGTFKTLQYEGSKSGGNARVRVRHTFETDSIVCVWNLTRSGGPELSAQVRFPTWATGGSITAVLRGGGTARLTKNSRRKLSGVRRIVLESGDGQGVYTVVPREFPDDAVLSVVTPSAQTSNPLPGPSLVVQLAGLSSWRSLELEVELLPGADDT